VGFQSGGLGGDIVNSSARRGLRFSKLVSVGNAVDVTPGEVLADLVDDPATAFIGAVPPGTRGGERLVDALRRARGRKPVVALAGGSSTQGAAAVASHTGSLAGDRRVWEAIEASTDITVVRTLEDLLGAVLFLQCHVDHSAGGTRRSLSSG
jgi:acyl-CoA synthetase (NDP forming)